MGPHGWTFAQVDPFPGWIYHGYQQYVKTFFLFFFNTSASFINGKFHMIALHIDGVYRDRFGRATTQTAYD
jgi:hypothetical protein